jgi:hypothetical protein
MENIFIFRKKKCRSVGERLKMLWRLGHQVLAKFWVELIEDPDRKAKKVGKCNF